MGLFDDLAGAAGGLLQGQGQGLGQLLGGAQAHPGASSIASSLLGMLGQSGGLAGLVQTLQQAGLGDVVGSWVGTGQNLPVSGQQLQSALGGQVQQLAAQHGVSADVVGQVLSQVLPGLVDHLTPNGQLPAGGALEEGLSALKSRFGL